MQFTGGMAAATASVMLVVIASVPSCRTRDGGPAPMQLASSTMSPQGLLAMGWVPEAVDEREPDRRLAVVVDVDGDVVAETAGMLPVCWLRDGEAVVGLVGYPRGVAVWTLASGAIERLPEAFVAAPARGPVSASPDGRMIAVLARRGPPTGEWTPDPLAQLDAIVRDTRTGEVVVSLEAVVSGPVWTASGDALAYVTRSPDAHVDRLIVRDSATRDVRELATGLILVLAPTSGPGDAVCFADYSRGAGWQAYRIGTAQQAAEPEWLWSYYGKGTPYVSPDGAMVAYGGDEATYVGGPELKARLGPFPGGPLGWQGSHLVLHQWPGASDHPSGLAQVVGVDPATERTVWRYVPQPAAVPPPATAP